MSRHRNFHNMDYDDERDDDDYDDDYDDDSYGRSIEEDFASSPSASQFMYHRQRLSSNNFAPPASAKLTDFIPETVDIDTLNDRKMFEQQSGFAQQNNTNSASSSNSNGRPTISYAPPPGFTAKPVGFSISRLPDTEASVQPTVIKAKDPTAKPILPAVSNLRATASSKRSDSKSPSRGKVLDVTPTSTPKGLTTTSSTHRLNQLAAISSATTTPRRERKREEKSKELINLVVVGHVDAGKSTMLGHVLYKLGCVDQRTIHKYKQESARSGKASFAFAWVLDETEEERSRGVTMDIARTCFETEHRRIVLLDAPGHKDFIPNMITGASQADAALLVVNATRGEFETGFENGGQTREHAMLLRSLGVSTLIVAVNKLDTVYWSRDRYSEVKSVMHMFLERQAGFSNVKFVPVSGLSGENLIDRVPENHPLAQWYHGECLTEIIDTLSAPKRASDGPLRAVINDIFKATTTQLSLSAKIESGELEAGDKVYIMPNADQAIVKAALHDDGGTDDCVIAGDQALLTLTGTFEPDTIQPGHVITKAGADALIPARRFRAKIVVFDIPIPIMKGTKAELFCHSLCEPVTFVKLLTSINKSNGKVLKEKPRCLAKNQSGVVELETDRDVAIEAYTVCKALGRITIRANGVTIAAGIIERKAD